MKPNFSKIAEVTAGKTKTTGISPFSELEISKVYPNPDQPRKQFDDIEELAATIKEHGLLQPITVVKKDDRYMIISGERRYKAHLHNESKTIKAYILDKTDDEIEELALIENIQRNDLTDYETAKGVVKLWESGRYAKKSDLAEKLGKKDSYISKAFSTLKLDTSIVEDIEQNNSDISLSVIDEIARVKDPVVQKEVYEKYSAGEITRDEIKDFKEPKKQKLLNEIKIIEHIEIFGTDEIYIRYEDDTDKLLGYKEAKEIIDKSKQEKILFELCSNNEECYEFLSSLSNRVEKDDYLILKVEENSPRGNEEIGNEVIESLEGKRTVIDYIVGIGKSILSPNKEYTYLPIEDIGGFYLYNTGTGATKMFKKDVTYKLKIEEIKQEQTKEVITRDEIKFTKMDNVKVIISAMEDYIKIHNAYLDGRWIKDSTGTLETHLDNDYEIELFRLLKENHELKKGLDKGNI